MRTIPLSEVAKHDQYGDLAALARLFHHAIVQDDNGIWRWQVNDLIRLLVDDTPVYQGPRPGHGYGRAALDLNALWLDFQQQRFHVEQLMKFYMEMGYSLCGFLEVFDNEPAEDYGLFSSQTVTEDSPELWTLLDYVLEKYHVTGTHP
jgi:hypothetical protein